MHRGWTRPEEGQWTRYGFLFADLFTALAMLFLLANTAGQGASGTTTSSVSSQCGLERRPMAPLIFTLSDADALRKRNTAAESAFSARVRSAMASDTGRVVGLVEVYGGSYNGPADVFDGITLAKGAIEALSSSTSESTTTSGPVFSQQSTLFQSFWDGDLKGQQVKVVPFFYQSDCGSKLSG